MSAITDILKADDQNVTFTSRMLEEYGILKMYDRLDNLFEYLHVRLKDKLANDQDFPFARRADNSIYVVAWDRLLRFYMLLSAQQQFLVAACHLFRGQISEVFGHVRRAIEGAGISYLSKSEPDIGELFYESDRQAFRRRTQTDKILPADDPFAAPLRWTIDIASNLVHNNFASFAHRVQQDWAHKDGEFNYKYSLLYHELNARNHGYFINISLWVLRAAERVSLLLAASLDLTNSDWDQVHSSFKRDLDQLYEKLGPEINQDR